MLYSWEFASFAADNLNRPRGVKKQQLREDGRNWDRMSFVKV
jgi:hypothetical protein